MGATGPWRRRAALASSTSASSRRGEAGRWLARAQAPWARSRPRAWASPALPGAETGGVTSAARRQPLLWLALAVASLCTLPYVLAALLPPLGRSFKGFFIFVDDHYFYLSFVRQAQDGALLF